MPKESAIDIAKKAIRILEECEISHLKGRVFDNAFSVFARTLDANPRLMVVGFNGSISDNESTNLNSIKHAQSNVDFSNLEEGIEKGWNGYRHLARRLSSLAELFEVDYRDVVYTNAILKCSQDARSIETEIRLQKSDIIEKSMSFMKSFTIPTFAPSVIVCHGNAKAKYSTASILRKNLGGLEITTLDTSSYGGAYAFVGKIGNESIPILCLRHLSRFSLNEKAVKEFRKLFPKENGLRLLTATAPI
jgi:hypothetical protein